MAGDSSMMDALVHELISLLKDNSPLCNNKCQSIVTRIKQYISSKPTKSELEYALSVLFKRENSLLHFISSGCCEKTLKGGIRDSLSLIIELLQKYSEEIAHYFVPIKNVCLDVVKRNCGAEVQKYSFEVIGEIIISKESVNVKTDLQIPALIEFMHTRCLTNKSIKPLALQGVYELYGAIAWKYPECLLNKCNSLVRHILLELKSQMRSTKNVKPCVIEGCMKALKGVLVNTNRAYDDEDPTESREIYSYIRDACGFQEEATRRVFQRAALDVFTTHIAQLWGWVVENENEDITFWLGNLSKWAARPSPEDRRAGIKAMKALHKQAMEHLETHPDDPMKNEFMLYYKKALNDSKAADYNMDLAIEGISGLMGLSGSEVDKGEISSIFRLILQKAEIDFPLDGQSELSDERLAKYLECLSNMCSKLHSATNDQLSAITRLWRRVVERYPHHYPRAQCDIVQSLNATMLKMAMCDASVFDKFLYPVVYQSVIVTCSHTLLEEAELQEELTGKQVITYQHYLKLWEGLFRIGYESKHENKVSGETPELRRSIVDKLYDCFIKSLIAIVDKLNVGYKRDDTTEEVKSDPENSLRGEVPQDHSVLCNLANLYREVLAELVPEKLYKWLAELITTFVNQSVKFPLVSAFYKLLAAILSVAQRADYFRDESEETQSLGQYVVRYLEDVMLHCHQYKNDLQASCLRAVVSVPIPLIDDLLAGIASVMQMIFQMGQSQVSLACCGMDALELWQGKLLPDKLKPILHLALPLFDPYLRSRGTTTELPDDKEKQMSKAKLKQARLIQDESSLSKLQRRMLRLLSQLDSATCLELLRRPVNTTAWSAEPTITFNLPFPDQRSLVELDPLLPRVVELALTSSDRQTKAAACEVLHTFVIVFIGDGPNKRSKMEPEIVKVLSRLMPSLLRLSCGSDLVARQLFHPLTFQLMHWFCHPGMLEVRAPVQTEAVLQAVWDGITDEEDTALQDFSALCLQEFVAWSIKQSSVEHLAESVGPLAVFRKIKSYCLHPSLAKRRGAAMAFSHVAKVFREEVSLVDQYWLEAMYHLVLNLELGGCHDHPATAALAHAEKVLRRQADLFNKASVVRRVPPALGSGVLQDVLKFLLQKCGSKSAICAVKCRELLVAMMKWVPDAPRPDKLEDMVRVCEGAGNDSVLPFQPSASDADHIRASIDCYAWAIKLGFIDPDVALNSPSRLVSCVQYFINLLDPTVVPTVFCSRQDFALTRAKCDVVVALFDLLAVTDEKIKHLPSTFFRAKFWKLLAVCVFSPHNIGLDWRNRELSDSLNDKLRLLLCTLRDHLVGSLQDLYDALSSQVLYDCTSCVDRLSHLCQGLRHLELKDKQYVDGLITLHKTDFLQHLKHGPTWNGNVLMKGVFLSMFDSEGLPLHPENSVKVFADQLLRLAIVLEAEVRTTLSYVIDSGRVNDLRASTPVVITKGQHFLALFDDRLIAHLLQDPDFSVTQLLRKPSVANVEIILQMLSASKYTKVKFNRSAEALVTSLKAAWYSLDAWAEASQSSSWLVTLMQALVQLLPPAKMVGGLSAAPVSPAIPDWLYRQIMDPSLPLECKAELVELLPSIVSERTDPRLQEVLRHLQNQFPVSTKELRLGSPERNTFVMVYKALLRTLVATGSVTMLRAVCESAADKDHACAEAIEAALVDIMKKHKDEVQIQALKMVHDTFLDESKDVDFRLAIMSRFLIIMLCYASKAAVTQFYADRVQNIIDVLEERLRQHDTEWKSKQQLVRKIGACRLMEPLFSRLDKTELENKEHPVIKAVSIPANEKLSKYLATAMLNVRMLSCSREELQELFRHFQCAAYNALMLFVCNTNQTIKHFSGLVFKEEPMRPIWRRIVPIEPKYIFPIDFDDYPKMKKQLVQMRSLVREGAANQAPAIYLPTQSLFNSSLQEDITCFDFSMYNVRDADRMQQVSSEESGAPSAARFELEEGCLNDHECMSTLTLVIRQLCERFPITGAEVKRPQPPAWMENLRNSLAAPDQPDNCRAFIVKLIINCEHYFKPYAHVWISPVMQCVLDNCTGEDEFNSLVHDIVCMLLNWHTVDIPEFTTEEKLKASEFLRVLVLRAHCEQSDVMNYNIGLIKSVIDMWKSFVSVPYQELLDLIRPPPSGPSPLGASVANPGVLLADVFLANHKLPFNQTGKSIYYEHLLVQLQRPESKMYKTTASVIGKLLKILSEGGPLHGEDLEFFNRVVDVVKPKDSRKTFERERNNDQFINCLYNIQINYPSIVKGFEAQCISFLSQYPASYTVMLLEILTSALEDFDFQKEAFSMLTDLPRFLKDESNPDGQVAALKLVKKLAPNLTPTQMSKLLPPVVSLHSHKGAKTRTVVYDILAWIYDHYRESRDDNEESQMKEAKSVLISGFADPDSKLQEKLYRYWSDQISSEGWGRLVDILRTLYSPSSEPAFLTSATTLLLDLCRKTDEYKRSIHNHPLSDCKFEKYAVSGSFRTQHAAFVPMFADTLASQISSLSMGSFDFNFQLRATQSPSSLYSATLQSAMSITSSLDQSLPSFPGPSTSTASFGQKYKQGPSFGSDYLVANDTTDGEPGTSHSPLRKNRIVRDKRKVSRTYANRNRAKAAQQERHEAERQKKREGEVTLTRDYRKGDLPDIQIPYSDVITALATLAKRDQLIARQLLVTVYKALVATGGDPDVAGVSSALDHILQSSTSHEPPLMATVLEMSLVKPEACRSPASVITQVCKNSHQMSVGALLVEARLMAEEGRPPPSKRGRGNTVTYDDWMYLAEIYHSLEEKDVVQGLFEDKIAEACSAAVREALQAEDQARWKKAHIKYRDCLSSQSGTAAENFLFEASLKCSAHMSKWKDLNTSLKENRLKNNMEDAWSDNWTKDHLLPWLFLSEIHRSQETTVLSVAQDFNSALNQWLGDPTRTTHIKSRLSEMQSVLLVVRGEMPKAKLASEDSMTQFLTVWQQLDSLNNHLRGSRLLSVHRLMDIDRFLELPPSSDVEWTKKVDQLLTQWKRTSPSKTDNLVSWETQAVYRNIFVRKLEAKAEKDGNRIENIGLFKLDNYLKTMECALKQKNFYVARNYVERAEREITGSGARGKPVNHLALSKSKVRLLRVEMEKDNIDKFLEVCDPLGNLAAQEASGSLEYPLNRDLHFHMAEVHRTLLSMVQERPSILYNLSASGTEKLADLELGNAPTSLKRQVVTRLEKAVAVTENRTTEDLADAYLRLTVFCHEIDDPQYRDKLIQSLLRAMKYGSNEARILFPCLLESSLAEHADLFISESKQVPEWMFLSWVSQLLAHLDTDVGHVVAPLLVNLAKAYPTALQFPFHLSKEMYQYSYPATRTTVAELSDLLRMDAPTRDLLRGLSCVCQPHLCLIYHLERLRTVVTQNSGNEALVDAYESMTNEAFPPNDSDKFKGKVFNAVKKFTDEVEKAYNEFGKKQISNCDFVKKLEVLYTKVKDDLERTEKRIELALYSPWLANEYNGDVEIPGQYTGESKPLPNHHVTIKGFKREVIPLKSLRWPTKITILGNDARDYPFLVKFGEDLRQDQRIQQLFVLMNQLLSTDVTASRRQLSVQTYSVVPLNSRLGIIQWVEKTTTLKNFMISKDLAKKAEDAEKIYHVQHFSRCNTRDPPSIARFYKTIKKEESTRMYRMAVNELPAYMLRDAVLKLSISPEAFFHLRSVMLTNHACLSVCHWLLGIGDRHLDNTLVCVDSGRLLGIDFGHAFGTATQLLSVPELMPFRLTPQLLNLAVPLGTTGLIKETMVHTLRVLRGNSRLLLATMAVFILEPSVDWLKAARRHEAYMEAQGTGSVDWLPQRKINLARQKLEGAHPRKVMEEDLKMGHGTKPHYKKLEELLWDEGDFPHLRDMPRDGLSPRQQVECLIAHATSSHILSKTYSGWASWV